MSGCEPRDVYVALLEQAGFEGICVSGPTSFATSPTTLGFNFVATKPLDALARARQPDDGSRRSFLVAVAAMLSGAVGVGVAMALLRRRS